MLEVVLGSFVFILSQGVWLFAWIKREQDMNKERFHLLERIQRPERIPMNSDIEVEFPHESPSPELALVGQINPNLEHRDRDNG